MGKKQKKKEAQRKNSVQESCGSESDISDAMMVIDVSKYSDIGTPCFLVIKNEEYVFLLIALLSWCTISSLCLLALWSFLLALSRSTRFSWCCGVVLIEVGWCGVVLIEVGWCGVVLIDMGCNLVESFNFCFVFFLYSFFKFFFLNVNFYYYL